MVEDRSIIRPFGISDYESVRALWENTPGVGLRSVDDSREGISKFLLRNPRTCFVAESGNAVTGSILGGYDGRRGYIYHLCVDTAHRGRGAGRELVESAVRALKGEGATRLYLVCFKDNLAGNAFWQSMGWEINDTVNYYGLVLESGNIGN